MPQAFAVAVVAALAHGGRATATLRDTAASRSKDLERAMFLFFSNRLGCLGSLLISLVLTALIVLIFWH